MSIQLLKNDLSSLVLIQQNNIVMHLKQVDYLDVASIVALYLKQKIVNRHWGVQPFVSREKKRLYA